MISRINKEPSRRAYLHDGSGDSHGFPSPPQNLPIRAIGYRIDDASPHENHSGHHLNRAQTKTYSAQFVNPLIRAS